jgi:hypothetical protein
MKSASKLKKRFLLLGLGVLLASACVAQFGQGFGRNQGGGNEGPLIRTEGGVIVDENTVRTARETAGHSVDLPDWTNDEAFKHDTFTFARIIFHSLPGRPAWTGWINDYPDADLNLSYRLHQLTSLRVDPDGRVLKLTDPGLLNFPLIWMSKPGAMQLRNEEITPLRKFLQNGGALVADDFWGDREWDNFASQIKRVLPEGRWTDLTVEHPIFHCVFDLKLPMNQLQVPSIHLWERGYDPNNPRSAASAYRGPGSDTMHVRAWLDDKQRIMVLALFNTDVGDGFEREGENETYFAEFAEPRAYPLMINIIYYLMTH